MPEERLPRRLAAILHADVAGYSRLAGIDEDATHLHLKNALELFSSTVDAHHGKVINFAGDAVLAMFDSVLDAVGCAAAVQDNLGQLDLELGDDGSGTNTVQFRVGVHLGDVIEDEGDIFGDGVNVAARIQGLADPGGICISEPVFGAVQGKLDLAFVPIGPQSVKNIAQPINCYKVVKPGQPGSAVVGAQRQPPEPGERRSRPGVWGLGLVSILAVAVAAWWSVYRDMPPEAVEQAVVTDRPSIAVLPFDNLSGDPNQDYFAEGMSEDLITDLSKISGIFVVARNSSFSYKGSAKDVREIARELGVRYVLEGSVRREASRVRINAQLIDGNTGGHLWAERFDGTMEDVFSLQDQVNGLIVSALAVSLSDAEQAEMNRVETRVPEAYDNLLKGFEQYQLFTGEANEAAREYFLAAIELDPDYARAYANVALTYASEVNFNWSTDWDAALEAGLEYAERALQLDPSIPQIYLTRSMIYLAQRRFDAAIEAANRTVEVHPGYADGYAALAFVLSYAGELEAALEAIHRGMELDPNYSYIYFGVEGRVLFDLGRYEEAIVALSQSISRNPGFARTHILLAASYAMAGDLESADWAVEEASLIQGDITLKNQRETSGYQRQEHIDHFIEALRLAGVPEE